MSGRVKITSLYGARRFDHTHPQVRLPKLDQMWRPSTWSDVEALIRDAEETATLDFKREPTSNPETAKDIAAMTVSGGIIIYGIDEDKDAVVASAITPFQLAGVEEKLRHVAGSLISPTPYFDVHPIVSPENDHIGVVVVVVPASSLAPHQVNGRYPYRRGTTTDYLDERAVERLYRQRQDLAGATQSRGALLDQDFVATLTGMSVGSGTGQLVLVVRPAASDATHPAGAWQQDALKEAVHRAAMAQASRFNNSSLVRTFSAISDWQAWQTLGWRATNAPIPNPPQLNYEPDFYLAANLAYPARLSFEGYWALNVPGNGPLPDYLCAREIDVARELIAMLAVAGEYFASVDGGGHLLVGARLAGFEHGRSQFATEGQSRSFAADLPGAPAGVTADARTSALDLRDTPERVARTLIERWLPAFFKDVLGQRDLFETLVPASAETQAS